jgi:heparosan-N-sulfate-glucuronate 5-epimerase
VPLPKGLMSSFFARASRSGRSRVVSAAVVGLFVLVPAACSWNSKPETATPTSSAGPTGGPQDGLATPTLAASPTGRPQLGAYFYDMAAELAQGWSYDADGIVLTPNGSDLEYNTVDISQYALGYYGLWWTTGSVANRTGFLHYADWMVDHQSSSGLWLYTYQVWTIKPPWHSALAQGQAISVLVRAWDMTQNQKYLTAATAAMRTFSKPYADDGVASYEGSDTFYEQYDPSFMPHVLNGFMFALIGLNEYHAMVGDAESGRLFDAGATTLARNLHRWDSGSGMYYNLATPPLVASGLYAGIHVAELQEMWRLTGNPTFHTYAARWASYLAPPAGSTP